MRVSSCVLGPTEVLKYMCLARFVAILDWLDTLYVPKAFGRAKNACKRATGTKDAAKGPASDWEWE